MKRTRVPYGESVFIGGRRCRISQSKGGGVNLYTDEDCPVVVGEASEVVDCREATVGGLVLDSREPVVGPIVVKRVESYPAELGVSVDVLRNRKARTR